MNDEWLSAHLDGELSEAEADELEQALADDQHLRSEYDAIARVRAVLRSASVEPPRGSIERIVAAVDAADAADAADSADATDSADAADSATPSQPRGLAPVVPLESRRRVPTFASVAAAVVIIASVVGGIRGPESLPAIGDLVEQHEAAAAIVQGRPMPEDMGHMDDMAMDEAMGAAPAMPQSFSMQHAFSTGSTVQLVYATSDGDVVSVFRHEGETDVGRLGSGSVSASPKGEMWSTQRVDAYVAVVDGQGYVWVVISKKPHDSMMESLMHDLPTRSPSVAERLRDTADAAVDPFRFWD